MNQATRERSNYYYNYDYNYYNSNSYNNNNSNNNFWQYPASNLSNQVIALVIFSRKTNNNNKHFVRFDNEQAMSYGGP